MARSADNIGALYTEVPLKAGTKGCSSRTLCALLTSLDIANGMKLLHTADMLHGNLSPHNVLLYTSHKVCALAEPSADCCISKDRAASLRGRFFLAGI